MSNRVNYGVTEVVGVILIILIVTSVTSSILLWALPLMEDRKAYSRLLSASSQFTALNTIVQDMQRQGVSSSRIVNFVVDEGNIHISSVNEARFVLYYSLDERYDFDVSGFDIDDDVYDETLFTITMYDDEGDLLTIPDKLNVYVYNLIDGSLLGHDLEVHLDDHGDYVVGNVDSQCDLTGTIKIDLWDAIVDEPKDWIFFGRILIFDVCSLSYQVSSPSYTYQIVAENGGVIRATTSGDGYFISEPNIYHKNDELLVMKIIQMMPDSDISVVGSGKTTYKFSINLISSYIAQNKVTTYNNFKMQIYGDNKDSWITYFISQHDFDLTNDILYLEDPGDDQGWDFTNIYYLCTFDVEVFG